MFVCLRKCKCGSITPQKKCDFQNHRSDYDISMLLCYVCIYESDYSSFHWQTVLLQKLGWVHRPLVHFLLLLFIFPYLQLLLYPELGWTYTQLIWVCFRPMFLLNIYQWSQQKEINFPFHMWIVSRILCIICFMEMCEALAVELVFWKERVVLD